MQINRRQMIVAGLAAATAWPARAAQGHALVAVAANFTKVAALLQPVFKAETGYKLTLASGGTGQIYAQILNGAPYDAFLAADQARPQLLEEVGLGEGRITYARGLLALWRSAGEASEAVLRAGEFDHLAIANPALAPYGQAAQEALVALGLWGRLKGKVVMGQNVGQAYALVASGNAALGLVARSYALGQGESWLLPGHLYSPIRQDALLLKDTPAAAAFLSFLQSDRAQEIILAAGYGPL